MIEHERFWFIPLGGTSIGARGMRSTRTTFSVIAATGSSTTSCLRHGSHGGEVAFVGEELQEQSRLKGRSPKTLVISEG